MSLQLPHLGKKSFSERAQSDKPHILVAARYWGEGFLGGAIQFQDVK